MLTETDLKLNVGNTAYLNALRNTVYGEDPRQGFVEKNTFYHPGLRFSFRFPEEWNLQNTPSKVVLASKDGNAALLLQAEKSSEDLKDYTNRKASQIEGGQFISERSLTINRMAGFQKDYFIKQQDKEDLRMRLSCIKKAGYIFTFSALSTRADFGTYDSSFHSVIGSFQNLKGTRYLNRRPQRVNLVKANGRESLRDIFQKAGMAEDLWQKFAIMNGMELDEVPKRGQPVKIVK
jgi:predicted Zn-dependent protease